MLRTKWTGMKEIKHRNFIDVIQILPCLNSSWIMGWRIYGGGRTQILLSSPTIVDSLAQDPGLTGFYTDIKIANNTKINHKMISFSDHYNALIIDRLASKTKIGKDLWHFNNSLLKNKYFCSTTQNFISLLKTRRNTYSSISDWWEYTKCQIKENTKDFSKNSTRKQNF